MILIPTIVARFKEISDTWKVQKGEISDSLVVV